MRRALTIFLILFFGFGPLALGLSASEDSRLPTCCRRHGKHHCAMYALMMAKAEPGKPILTAPPTCPLFPGFRISTTASVDAITAPSAANPLLLRHRRSPAARRAAPYLSPIGRRAGRSPPATSLG